MADAPEPPKLFISYAWTDDKHKQWVERLAEKLRASSVEALLDKWELMPGQDKNAYMEKMVTDPNITKVIMVVDKNYAKKANDREGGVGTEAYIIANEISKDKDQKKFAAVVLEKDEKGEPYLPAYCASRIYLDFSEADNFEEEFKKLRRWIRNEPLYAKPPLGDPPQTQEIQVSWTDREICRAAVKTYFSLEDMPVDSEDNGDFMGFESAAGYIYTCRLEGNIALLKWVNATNDVMTSKKTSFKLNGNTLVVTDNSMGSTKTFTKG